MNFEGIRFEATVLNAFRQSSPNVVVSREKNLPTLHL